MQHRLNDRIELQENPTLKKKYTAHALKIHGLKLGAWIRTLMKRDYESFHRNSR